ncbi:class I SAM-dependent methyltransferase [Prosthecobacter sp.]|uniref:class I SAM-dependent methyltransferase n=1 Tax=Prosthecobacter sp. TaxID=1965333 RepID=UPI002ABA1C66|nr:class I SAM-dependent methyltransferase [Prosthecobacter sp.]MDZ4405406.1 class I SAM-dependent methyltransferase [Prosthecobacter sp.]
MNPSSFRNHAIQPATWIATAERTAFEAAGTTAHRLASGSEGWVERLGDDAMISHKNGAALNELAAGLVVWSAQAQWTPARVFTRFLPLKNHERVSPILRSGDASLPITTVVTEAGIRYGLDFGTGYSHGLFLDQRANRAKLHALKPKRLLNTFAYTCSFSVVAGLAGAETVSVDLSRKSLDRGKQNLALNGIAEAGHRFINDDTLELLPKLGHRGERFDAIVLDPPTFSRGNNGRLWQVEQHFEDLMLAALEVAAPKCAILLSTNCTKLNPTVMERQARACAKIKRRTTEYMRMAAAVDFPPGHGASTLWMMVR